VWYAINDEYRTAKFTIVSPRLLIVDTALNGKRHRTFLNDENLVVARLIWRHVSLPFHSCWLSLILLIFCVARSNKDHNRTNRIGKHA
jgi:hypothetical protein